MEEEVNQHGQGIKESAEIVTKLECKNGIEKEGLDNTGIPCHDYAKDEHELSGNVDFISKHHVDQKRSEVPVKGVELLFKVVWNKLSYDVALGSENSVLDLRKQINFLTGIPVDMQKIMYKGLVKDDDFTLKDIRLTNGAKVMVIGSTLKDLETVKTPTADDVKLGGTGAVAASKEPLCQQKMHKKVLDKGKPEDLVPGIKGIKEALPAFPLSGFVNKTGGKVRLTFKLDLDQLWIGTKERTEKIPMSSVKTVVSEPIEGHEEYHILAIQLGPTEASRYWLYWFPAQYVDAVKDAILGKWQPF